MSIIKKFIFIIFITIFLQVNAEEIKKMGHIKIGKLCINMKKVKFVLLNLNLFYKLQKESREARLFISFRPVKILK